MAILGQIAQLWKDPPPAYAFEVSEAGIAFAPTAHAGQLKFYQIEPDVLNVSPSRDNVQRPEVLSAHVAKLVPQPAKNKRRGAALILPDYSARVQVLDFDSFPPSPDEQTALIRFRVKKSVPFDVDTAIISYYAQPANANGKIDVVAAIVSLEIVARYEAPFRAAGFWPGHVTTSSLAALSLLPQSGLMVVLKLCGRTLTVMALDGPKLKLVRCVELSAVSSDEILSVLFPTLAYIEDEMSGRAEQLLLCGFGDWAGHWGPEWEREFGIPVELVRSRLGPPGPFDAGLLGYLQGAGAIQ